jgi:hypothetical protein
LLYFVIGFFSHYFVDTRSRMLDPGYLLLVKG